MANSGFYVSFEVFKTIFAIFAIFLVLHTRVMQQNVTDTSADFRSKSFKMRKFTIFWKSPKIVKNHPKSGYKLVMLWVFTALIYDQLWFLY